MTGYTPIPNELVDPIVNALKKKNRKLALEVWLLNRTCRRDGWDSLKPGQVRVTISDLTELLSCNRGNASHLLRSVMEEWGMVRVADSVLCFPEATATLTATPTATQNALSLNGFCDATATPTATPTATASITILQESKKNRRSAPLSESEESMIQEGVGLLKDIYPLTYHDGKASARFSPSLTKDRIRKLAPKHGVSELFDALERYYLDNPLIYWKAPQNFLGPEGPYRDYLAVKVTA